MYYVWWPLLKTNTRTLFLSKIQLEEFGWSLFVFYIREQALKNKSLNIFVVAGKLSGQQFQVNIPLFLVKGWYSVSGKIVGISYFCLKAFNSCFNQTQLKTRMHSSRMRTGRSLTVCCSLLPGGGGVLLGLGGCSPWSGGGLGGGCSPWSGGVLLGWGGVLPGMGGGSSLPGGSPETPPVNRITDTCKNITLTTTSLRPVITCSFRNFVAGT